MKRILFAACLALATLSSTACATKPLLPVVEDTLVDEKALYTAEAAYNIAASAYIAADTADLMKPEIKAKVKPLMVKAYAALLSARDAYLLLNASAFSEQVSLALKLSKEAAALIPQN